MEKLSSTAGTATTAPLPLESIFHPSDLAPGSQAAFTHALKLALAARAKLTMMHVRERSKKGHSPEFPKVRKVLARWKVVPENCSRDDVEQLGLRVFKTKTRGSDPLATIIGHLASHATDLVVLTTYQRRGLSRWLHRPTAEPILRQSRVLTLCLPVRVKGFVAALDGSVSLARILIPVDKAPHPQSAVEAAIKLVGLLGCQDVSFELLHVGDAANMPEVHLPPQAGWSIKKTVRTGDPVEEILRRASKGPADLIVMATQGHQGFLDVLRGSTTEQVLRGAACPVLAVPAS